MLAEDMNNAVKLWPDKVSLHSVGGKVVLVMAGFEVVDGKLKEIKK